MCGREPAECIDKLLTMFAFIDLKKEKCVVKGSISLCTNVSYQSYITCICFRDGVITIQMYLSTSTITLNMHEYEYKHSENTCTQV